MDERSTRNERILRSILKGYPPLPRVREADPYRLLGVFRSTIAQPFAKSGGRPPYVERDVDGDIRSALRSSRLLVLTGLSKAGKSRTAFEAAYRVHGDRSLIAPRAPVTRRGAGAPEQPLVAMAEEPLLGGISAVLWLDKAESHMLNGHLTLDIVGELCDRFSDLVIIAIITKQDLESLLHAPGSIGPMLTDLLEDSGTTLKYLKPDLSERELRKAVEQYPGNEYRPGFGRLGEFFSAWDGLFEKYQEREGLNQAGAAVIRAALDWQRAGATRPITYGELFDLTVPYLADIDVGLDLAAEVFEDGLAWARKPVASSAALLTRVAEGGEDGFRVFPRLLEWAQTPQPGGEAHGAGPAGEFTPIPGSVVLNENPVPAETWDFVLGHASAGDYLPITAAAAQVGQGTVADEAVARAAAEQGPAGALASIIQGNLLQLRDAIELAVAAYERAVDSGYREMASFAALELARLHSRNGRLEPAKEMYQMAIADGGPIVKAYAELFLGGVLLSEGNRDGWETHTRASMSIGNWSPLERFLASEDTPDESAVDTLLSESQILTLGYPAGDTSIPGHGTKADLLHFTIDDKDGNELVVLPIFTNVEFMRDALYRNLEWRVMAVLGVEWRPLWENIDDSVIVVVNPWSPLEYQFRPRTRSES
jgi:cellulose synthase operon protein C